jgi:acyl carrier protein
MESEDRVETTGEHDQVAVLKAAQTLFRDADITLDDNFFELGGDSLMAMEFIDHLENGAGLVVSFEAVVTAATLRDLTVNRR